MVEDGRDAGLLEHDLREPDGIGIAGSTPGQIALVAVIPGEERAPEARPISVGKKIRQSTRHACPLLLSFRRRQKNPVYGKLAL